MTDNKKAKELLDRYLRNECTPAEQNLVEQWYDSINLEREMQKAEWAEASRELFLRQHQRRNSKQHHFAAIKWAAAAAILIILAGAGLFFSGNLNQRYKVAVTAYSAVTGASGLKHIRLPDSSLVWLNANSKLQWTSDFGKDNRTVVLRGEAAFDVRHDAKHPFIVRTPAAEIKVLGTYFNVETDAHAVNTQVALLRGKVAVSLNSNNTKSLVLLPGEVAACSASDKTLRKYRTDVQPYFSWINGGFYARDMPLEQVVEKLCSRYGYTVIWNSRRGSHKHISVSFPRQEFRRMLESLCYLNHLHYTIHDHSITIQ